MKKILSTILNTSLVVSAILGLTPRVTQAASLQVAPLNNYVWVPGGEIGVAHFTVTNQAPQAQVLRLEAKSFNPDINGSPQLETVLNFPYLFYLLGVPGDYNLLVQDQSLRLDLERTFIVPAKSSQDIWIGIEPPLGITEGEYPISLIFTATSSDGQQEEILVESGVGGNLIVLVAQSNADKSQLSIEDLGIASLVDSIQGLDLQALIKNEGPTGTLIDGYMQLWQGDNLLEEWPFARDLVLGNHSRLARADARVDQMDRANYTQNWRANSFLLGPYTLKVAVASGHQLANQGIVETSISFFALPYWALLGVLTLALIIIVVVQLTKKKRQSTNTKTEAADRFDILKQQAQAFAGSKKAKLE